MNRKEIYTLIKEKKCLSSKPYNTYYINEELKIIDYCDNNCKSCSIFEECDLCEEGYIKNYGKC